jgi:hypothetical protein
MYLFLLIVFQMTSLPQDAKKEDNAMESEANSTAAPSSICKGPVMDEKLQTWPTDDVYDFVKLLLYDLNEFNVELRRNSEALHRLSEKVPVTNLKS